MKNPILDLPLANVMRSEIALPLQHIFQIHTVGAFLRAWRNPQNHSRLEQIFDTPQQAHHAAAICAAWLGIKIQASPNPTVGGWWVRDDAGVPIGITSS